MRHAVPVRLATVLMLLAPAPGLGAPVSNPPAAPPGARRALLISVDGLRPDLILRARTPAMRSLMQRGSFTLWAATTAVSVTLPSHVSMLTGVPPAKHRIEWNRELPLARPVYPQRPTLFEVAKKAGYTTAMAVGKSKLSLLAKPGTVDWSFAPEGDVTDSTVTDSVVRWIGAHRPQVLFVHLPGVDVSGHDHGWGSREQLAAVESADRSIARMLEALRRLKLEDSTVVLVTADHGGAGHTHGPDDPRSRMIPWIIAGPGIRADVDLTSEGEANVRTEDTFATLCFLLGIPPSEGRAVIEILEDRAAPGR